MSDFTAFLTQPKQKLPFLWPASLNLSRFNPIPAKYRPSRRLRLRQRAKSTSAADENSVTKLQTSFNPLDSVRDLRRRRWRLYDLQYIVIIAHLAFSLCILPPAPLLKTGVLFGASLLLMMPISRQFFLPSLPIWVYLLYFFSSRYIAPEYRPHIWVKVLPALENVLYGANLSNILSAHTHPILDILAWLPYGLAHFSMPAIASAVMFLFAAPGTTPVFARAFGYMCMFAVTIQIVLPCTPPWYEKNYGLVPAHYGMQGSPAGLARIDQLLGFDMYTTSFSTAPVPFGAFPSLHGANAVLEALFLQYCFPRFRAIFITYVVWIFWATMYLNHHYAIDVVAGGLMAASTYYVCRTRWLPRPQLDKSNRWEYEYVEVGDRPKSLDLEYGYMDGFGLGLLERRGTGDSDEWTIGSSSSFESMSRGETLSGSSQSTPGSLSPATPDDEARRSLAGIAPLGNFWDSDRRGPEGELSEVVVVRS